MNTPIRRQYLEIKKRFPETIVFFRLGDFYETFDEDAKLVSRELEITLTSKPMGKNLRVPLAGVPHHSLQTHLKRLVGRGFRVAVCEQTQDPKQTKGLVAREVVRVVTPGTVVEEDLLSGPASNYLVALAPGKGSYGLAFLDITTGEFATTEVEAVELRSELARLNPSEVIRPEGAPDEALGLEQAPTDLDGRLFKVGDADQLLREHFQVASMEAFGLRGLPLATAAAGAALSYIGDTQRSALANVTDLQVYTPSGYLVLDSSARRHLELFGGSRDGGKQSSLLASLDTTLTPMGKRLLERWLSQPLLDPEAINARLDEVEALWQDAVKRDQTREQLKALPDLERIVGRVRAGSATSRDLTAMRNGLAQLPNLFQIAAKPPVSPSVIETLALLRAAIAEEPSANVGEGGVIAAGFSAELDEIRLLAGDVRRALSQMENEERERTGIRSLRVAYNRVFGYYIEVSNANLDLVPEDFQRRQTLVGAERFITPRLKELEDRILSACERMDELENSLFRQVCTQIAGFGPAIQQVAQIVAELDVFSALAETAARHGYRRPEIDEGNSISIEAGRHPVVEQALGEGRFVPNDTLLDTDDGQIVVLTGPNMAGKSTYLRQVALITLLAQAGSFVPAASARIGIIDRIFTRIGAQDDLSRGESTFMVEMLETAAILRGASQRSLLLIDEVGRGTSTYDGLAIARAVVEYLHNYPGHAAKTLFATHYHEMTQLAQSLPRVRNFSVAVAEQDGTVVFLHRIVEGGADRSYGIHVAELAGMPATVIQRAREVLATLEETSGSGKDSVTAPQLPLIARRPTYLRELEAIDPNELTPLEALQKIYELKKDLRESRPD